MEKGHRRLIYTSLQPYTSNYEGIRLSLQSHGNPKRLFSTAFLNCIGYKAFFHHLAPILEVEECVLSGQSLMIRSSTETLLKLVDKGLLLANR